MKIMSVWSSFGEETFFEQFQQTVCFTEDPGIENQVLDLYPDIKGQKIEGFGGAVTDAAGEVYAMMNAEQRAHLVHEYFSPERMHYTVVRVPMDSCDFSSYMHEADSDPEDEKLEKFSFAETEKYILPLLQDAKREAGKLELILSPWSPPAFMKTNGERKHGGKLKREYYRRWGEYICRYIREFEKRGFFVRGITLQNEPHASQSWDSCRYTGEEERTFLEEGMLPALDAEGYGDKEIYIWDHNKERLVERMGEVLSSKDADRVTGAAFHWYSGDHFEALAAAKKRWPDKKLMLSESAVEMYKFGKNNDTELSLAVSHEIAGDLANGAGVILDWNILLNEEGGPNHVGNFCIAPFLYDRNNKKLVRHMLANQFEHFSRFFVPGSIAIAASRFSSAFDAAAAKRPDGSIAAALVNRGSSEIPLYIRLEGEVGALILPPQSVTSCIIEEK